MRTIRIAAALCALVGICAFAASALTPYLVHDIDPRFVSEGSSPHDFVSLGGRVAFLAGHGLPALYATAGVPGETSRLGTEDQEVRSRLVAAGPRAYFAGCGGGCGLWSTDGTPGGTFRIVATSFVGSSNVEAVALAGSGAPRTFVSFDAGRGNDLWTTDGTPGGARRVALAARRVRALTGGNGKVFFFADLPSVSGALFSSDGQPGGTHRLGSSRDGRFMTLVGGRLLYQSGSELWASDGTPAGTRRLAILPNAGAPITAAGGRGYFFLYNGGLRELWASDGTAAGSRRVATEMSIGQEDLLAAVGARVAYYSYDDPHGYELWTSDGTTAGTRMVKDLCPGTCSGAGHFGISALGKFWFDGQTPARGSELWTSDLSPAGTRLVRDLCRGNCSGDPLGLFAAGSRIYFTASGTNSSRQIWTSDGSAAGTIAVSPPGQGQSLNAAPFGASGIVFAGIDDVHGAEPWISNGTPAGTFALDDLDSDNVVGSDPRSFAAAGDLAFFFADDGEHGRELWASDGTSEGTRLAYDSEPGPEHSDLADARTAAAGGNLVLFGHNGFGARTLFGSDGTPAGSASLLPDGARADGRFLAAGSRVFFVATDPAHGSELWATDGTPGGTVRLTDLVPPDPFRPDFGAPVFLALGDRVVAPVLSPGGGEELLISDGTPGGTRSIDEIYPFLDLPLSAAKSQIAELDGRYWFVAANPGDGVATLLRTDLTAAGTVSAGPLDLSNPTSFDWALFPLGTRMLAFGPSNSLGTALWSSDGTVVETHVLGSASFDRFVPPVDFAGRLWYSNRNFDTLWSTDGTAAGTVQAMDSAGQPIRATSLALLGGRLVIRTQTGFFESDGTPAGTLPIDLPGPPHGSTLQILAAGDRAYFTLDDFAHGPELWALRPD